MGGGDSGYHWMVLHRWQPLGHPQHRGPLHLRRPGLRAYRRQPRPQCAVHPLPLPHIPSSGSSVRSHHKRRQQVRVRMPRCCHKLRKPPRVASGRGHKPHLLRGLDPARVGKPTDGKSGVPKLKQRPDLLTTAGLCPRGVGNTLLARRRRTSARLRPCLTRLPLVRREQRVTPVSVGLLAELLSQRSHAHGQNSDGVVCVLRA
mmetsp:Transcript_123885/g.284145  ORF Transcript_123885/g.284145 Transcript_123885/m.284145 type:complete len:203 (-) Transcript_123885:175-783(-)